MTVPGPNEDFYLHVNQKWLEDPDNSIPSEYSRWGGFIKLADEGLKNQIDLVKELKDKDIKTEEESKIYAIWSASTALFESWERGEGDYSAIKKELDILDSFLKPETPIADEDDMIARLQYLHYSKMNGIRNVLDFDKGSDLQNANNVLLDISTCGLSLPGRDYYTEENFAEKKKMFKAHLENVVKLLGSECPLDPESFVDNVMAFEDELAKYKMKNDQSRRYDEYYTNTTLDKLYTEINDLRSLAAKEENYKEEERGFKMSPEQVQLTGKLLEKLYETFDLKNVLRINHAKNFSENDEKAPNLEAITAFDGDGFRRVLAMILNPENLPKYRAFLQYKIITACKKFCTRDLDEEYFDFYSRKLSGQAEQKPRDKRAIQLVELYGGEMLGKIFVARYFPEEYKADVEHKIHQILDTMKVSIDANDWLTPQTKEKAKEKLAKFCLKIGYPDKWKDYTELNIKEGDSLYEISKEACRWKLQVNFYEKINSVLDRTEWLMTPQTVNAYFMPTQNEIVFPAAILQPPFYHQSQDTIDFDIEEEVTMAPNFDAVASANFGGILAVIAHEITHGYDDKGRKFNGDGNLDDWWTQEDTQLFTAKSDIMGKQAEKYKFIDVEDNNKEYTLNPQLTMGENLADLGGLGLSLGALMMQLEKESANSETIRASQRVLFKSFANIWKQNTKKDHKIMCLSCDPHSPCDFRANLVKNMNEFYDAFDVKEDDHMYIAPEERVRMW